MTQAGAPSLTRRSLRRIDACPKLPESCEDRGIARSNVETNRARRRIETRPSRAFGGDQPVPWALPLRRTRATPHVASTLQCRGWPGVCALRGAEHAVGA